MLLRVFGFFKGFHHLIEGYDHFFMIDRFPLALRLAVMSS